MIRYIRSTASVAVFVVFFTFLFASVAVQAQSGHVTLWNTLGSDTEITNSQIGPGGKKTGGYFAPGPFPTFGQAFVNVRQSPFDDAFSLTFPADSVVSKSEGTIAFWAKLNDFPSAPGIGMWLLDSVMPTPGGPLFGLQMAFGPYDSCGGGGLTGTFGVSTEEHSYCTGVVDTGTEAASQNHVSLDSILGDRAAWHHYAIVWNEMGISQLGGRKVYLYLDGNLVATPYYHDGGPWGPIPGGSRIRLAWIWNMWGVSIAVDNVIVWDYVKTDFSDRFNENPTGPVGLSPRTLTFGDQPIGVTSAPKNVTLTNTGNQPLSISNIAVTGTNSGDFAQTNNCGSTVQPDTPCTLTVTFTPKATGTRSAVLTITDNAAGSPHGVLLTGTGGVPAGTLTPASLTFASQAVGTTSAPKQVTLKNTGNGPLSITSIAVAGDFGQSNNCGSTVNPGRRAPST